MSLTTLDFAFCILAFVVSSKALEDTSFGLVSILVPISIGMILLIVRVRCREFFIRDFVMKHGLNNLRRFR